jgi:hypothetical protein
MILSSNISFFRHAAHITMLPENWRAVTRRAVRLFNFPARQATAGTCGGRFFPYSQRPPLLLSARDAGLSARKAFVHRWRRQAGCKFPACRFSLSTFGEMLASAFRRMRGYNRPGAETWPSDSSGVEFSAPHHFQFRRVFQTGLSAGLFRAGMRRLV